METKKNYMKPITEEVVFSAKFNLLAGSVCSCDGGGDD